jgi:flavorubredoxin
MEPFTPTTDEIADGIYRIATFIPDVSPEGFTFNQFLVTGEEPLLFHTGMRALFPLVAEAVAGVVPVESLRWITFGHVEADESGSMNMWLAAAPNSQVAHGALGCDVSLNDLCDRPPRALEEGEIIDTGGHRLRQISTPHVPHGWEAQVLFDETTGTLLCGDLLSQLGAGPAVTTDDIVERAIAAEEMFHASSLAPHTADTIRALGDLGPTTLAIMHGSSYSGDGKLALHAAAARYEALLDAAEARRTRASVRAAYGSPRSRGLLAGAGGEVLGHRPAERDQRVAALVVEAVEVRAHVGGDRLVER